MVETGTYEELLKCSSSFRHLLENIHQQPQEQHERAMITDRRHMSICKNFSETENEEVTSESTNVETKKEGSVNWRVYISYMRAGAGLVLSILLTVLVFGVREATSVFYTWWLAEWSDDESHRHRQLNNCTEANNKGVNTIRLMNDTEWKNYQTRRFHIYSGLFM
jgi:hypothetical protein